MARKTPAWLRRSEARLSSSLSGTSAHRAMAMKEIEMTYLNQVAVSRLET